MVAPSTQDDQPGADPAGAPRESRAARLLSLVRKLIDYGRELAATIQQHGAAAIPRQFGTNNLSLILARITRGLHRARALEERLIRNPARLDAPPRPSRVVSSSKARTTQPPAPCSDPDDPHLAQMPTPEQIAARVRRQPIGAVLADICRDLGIVPGHPLWRELSGLILREGGNLARLMKEVIAQAGGYAVFASIAAGLPPGPSSPSPSSAGAGPPGRY
jgi:hypothetical protein